VKLKNKKAAMFLFLIWGILTCGGFWKLMTYANTPGVAAHKGSPQWPIGSALARASDRPNLVIFVHPLCPCSEATIGELARLMPHIKDKINTLVVFNTPATQSDDWARKKLWMKAKEIPGVNLVLDKGGVEVDRFGGKTSGQTFLYDQNGVLIFSGGITPSRGHMGDSTGRDTIITFAETGKMAISNTSVFGCSLKNPERAIAGEIK
jgi:hypothetical protein